MSLRGRGAVLAEKMLRKMASTVTYKAVTAGAYNPATGAATVTETAVEVYAYQDAPSDFELSTGLVQNGDIILWVSDTNFTAADPKPGDRVLISGLVWQVMAAAPTHDGGATALWRLTLRK